MAQSQHHDVYRLYITNHIPGLPAFHAYDTLAMFGYKYPSTSQFFNNVPDFVKRHMAQFKVEIQSVVRQFVHSTNDQSREERGRNDQSREEGWGPGVTKVLTDTAPWSELIKGSVQGAQCEFWRNNDMTKYGWQN